MFGTSSRIYFLYDYTDRQLCLWNPEDIKNVPLRQRRPALNKKHIAKAIIVLISLLKQKKCIFGKIIRFQKNIRLSATMIMFLLRC